MGNGREIFKPILDDNEIIAGFSTKLGGVSKGAYKSLNLALHVKDNEKDVYKNREILKQTLGLKKLIFMNQTHSNIVKIIDNSTKDVQECDSIITNEESIGLCAMVADCAPILLYNSKQKVISAIHAGRAGVMSKILTNTIKTMNKDFSCKSEDIVAIIGPNIKRECYEIKGIKLGKFSKYCINNKFDINLALRDELIENKVKNFKFLDQCTYCDKNYFSYRRDGLTGRFAGIIAKK